MTRQVELRNNDLPVIERVEVKGWRDGILGDPQLEVFPPLTPNIIRHEHTCDTSIDRREKSGQESEVHV